LILLQNAADAAATAEEHFRAAIDWAHRQDALSWELRTATSLARLWRDQYRPAEARDVLRPVYDRFTEGLMTTDLKQAKNLLEQLS
jgi:predicted ATPase